MPAWYNEAGFHMVFLRNVRRNRMTRLAAHFLELSLSVFLVLDDKKHDGSKGAGFKNRGEGRECIPPPLAGARMAGDPPGESLGLPWF